MNKKKIMAGIDLHSNNAVCGLMDQQGKRLGSKRLPCELSAILAYLKPYESRIQTIAVESTYNWYWLVDGLQDHGYHVVLANPAQIDQYDGLKHTDDKSDAYFLTELLRLNILPTGWLCERHHRSVRDMLRRRLSMVRQRTSLFLSIKSHYARTTGQALPLQQLKKAGPEKPLSVFQDRVDLLIHEKQLELIEQYNQAIGSIEQTVSQEVKSMPNYQRLQSIPGIGQILGLTITLESGEIHRFASAGDYASYCRCVDSKRLSNGKKKGRNNGKCGNKYLAWAFVEAANYAKRHESHCRAFFDRKSAKTNSIIATKALACKLAKAAWHMMKEQTNFDLNRVFPGMQSKG